MWQGRVAASVSQTRNGEGPVGLRWSRGVILRSTETTISRSNEQWNPLVNCHFRSNDRGSKPKPESKIRRLLRFRRLEEKWVHGLKASGGEFQACSLNLRNLRIA